MPSDRRVHLAEYAEAELREMPDGDLCDLLALEAIFVKCINGKPIKAFQEDDAGPFYWIPSGKPQRTHMLDAKMVPGFSRDWSAAGRALEWLAANLCPDSEFQLILALDGGDEPWVVLAQPRAHNNRMPEPEVLACAPTPQLAICRAALCVGRRRAK